jgi:hypothetical protein
MTLEDLNYHSLVYLLLKIWKVFLNTQVYTSDKETSSEFARYFNHAVFIVIDFDVKQKDFRSFADKGSRILL